MDVTESLRRISAEDWEKKVEGLKGIGLLATQGRLSANSADLHPVVAAAVAEARNLRSSVSREALILLGQLAQALKRGLDGELDKVRGV